MPRLATTRAARVVLAYLAIVAGGCAPQPRATLRVCTLNMAHGRGLAATQIGLPRETIEHNLVRIVALLRREKPDLVALQEADAASAWSGRFNHVEFLARAADYPHQAHALHVDVATGGLARHYGTALLARQPPTNTESHAFHAEPRDPKGYALAEMDFAGRTLLLVSVHLDYRRATTRRRQARALIDRLGRRALPVVLMGDFNSRWDAPDDAVRLLVEQLDLRAYRPGAAGLNTYPSIAPFIRIDWILVSPELEFLGCRTVPDRVSDHLATIAELAWRTDPPLG